MKQIKSEMWECTETLRKPFRWSAEEKVDDYLLSIRDHLVDMLKHYDEVEVVMTYTGRIEE